MHRIDGAGATTDNRFTEGNPQAGVPATVVTADWLNSIQEELVSVIGEQNLDKNSVNQLLNAIKALSGEGTIGRLNLRIVDPNNLPALAPNELVPMGQLLNRADYPEFWEYIQASGAMVTDSVWNQANREAFYSSGNGSTTFRPGNLVTGVFPRFLDLTGLYDPDRASRVGGNVAGSWQGDAIRNITGTTGNNAFPTSFDSPPPSGAISLRDTPRNNISWPSGSDHGRAIDFNASQVVPTGSDNRPTNIVLLPTYIYRV